MARVEINRKGIMEMEHMPEMQQAMLAKALEGEAAVKAVAQADAYDRGDYHDEIETVGGAGDTRVVAKNWKSYWIEYGNVKMRARAPMRKGMSTIGRLQGGDR